MQNLQQSLTEIEEMKIVKTNCFVFLKIFLLLILMVNTGCDLIVKPISVCPIVPPRGYIFHHNRAPLIFPTNNIKDAANYSQPDKIAGVKLPEQIIYIKLPIPRTYLLDMAFKRSDIEFALNQAGIKRILYADYEYLDILGYYRNFTVHAYGYKE